MDPLKMDNNLYLNLIVTTSLMMAIIIMMFISVNFLRRMRRNRDLLEEDEIAKVAIARAEETKAKALQAFIEKNIDPAQITYLIENIKRLPVDKAIGQSDNVVQIEPVGPVTPPWEFAEDLIKRYHERTQTETAVQFVVGIIASILGFVIFLGFLIFALFKSNWSTVMPGLPGALTTVIGLLFLNQTQRARKSSLDFFDRLRADHKITQAIRLIESLDDTNIRAAVKSLFALTMGGVDTTRINFDSYLSKIKPLDVIRNGS